MIERLAERIETPCFVVDKALLRKNLAVLDSVRQRTGVKILLAQKAFSMYAVYPLLAQVLDGTCASSPDEARLGREEFGKEVTAFAAGYSEQDLRELLALCDVVITSESFAKTYTGESDFVAALHKLDNGRQVTGVTMGKCGSMCLAGGKLFVQKVYDPGVVVDTTGAGDAFTATLAVRLAEGESLLDACRAANAAAGESVTVRHVMPSLPRRK